MWFAKQSAQHDIDFFQNNFRVESWESLESYSIYAYVVDSTPSVFVDSYTRSDKIPTLACLV